jgi:hypothetical protein
MGDNKTARKIHDTREYLMGFMARIKEEQAEDGRCNSRN